RDAAVGIALRERTVTAGRVDGFDDRSIRTTREIAAGIFKAELVRHRIDDESGTAISPQRRQEGVGHVRVCELPREVWIKGLLSQAALCDRIPPRAQLVERRQDAGPVGVD